MGQLVHFPRHLLHRDCGKPDCFVCEGGLALCLRCGGAEGSLPTDCPGRHLTAEEDMLIMGGQLDYYHRYGWTKKGKGEGAA